LAIVPVVSLAFPRGVKLSVTKVALSDADKQKLDEVVDSDQTIGDYVAFDIKFYDADGNEIQPNIPIEVRFELAADNILAGVEELEVFHIKDGVEPVEQIEDGSKDVVIEADSFSVYVVGVTTVLAAAASSAKSIKMNSNGGNVTQFIFVFNVYDKETGSIRTTTLHGQNHKQGNHLDREATFDDGNLGEWSIGDEIISVDVYDLSGNYLLTVLPAAFTHRSSGGVIQTDGTTFGDGGEILQLNGGTANFWFGGVSPIPGTKIVIEKIWLDQDGNEIVSLRNKNVTIIVESPLPSNADVVFGENKLPGTLVVPTNSHPTYGADHTFSEVIGSALPDGYDSSEYVRVEFGGVDQNSADGKFVLDTSTLTPDQTYKLTYVNKLTASPGKGQFTPKVEKVLTGIASTEQIFNFSLVQVNALGEAVTGGITRTASTTAGNYMAGAQAVTFDEIGGLDPGTYYFKVTETAGTALGWAYSTASYTITVTVAYNGDTMVTYPGGYNGTDNLAPFTNAYSPNSTTANFTASKIISGLYPLEMTAGQFGFAVKNGAGTIVAEATNDADGNIVFPKLTFTETGLYNYTIVETSTDGDGFRTDKTIYEASVTVTDAGGGELAASVSYKAGSAPTFTNEYSPNSVDANFTASKIITGPYPLDMTPGQFGFAVKNGAGAIVAEATNDADGNIVFPKLTFTATGTYNYTVVETSTDGNGFRTDKSIYEASVEVTDAGGGQLAASVSYKAGSAPEFVNDYDPGSVDANFTASKTITGSYPFGMTAGQFGFAVKNGDDIVIAEATNDADGNIVFPIMTFTEAGTYNYTIVETSLGGNGWTMDDTEYPVTVTVTEDGSGELAAEVTYPEGDPAFVNTYEANISVEVFINTIQRTSAAYQNDDEDINNVNDEEFRYDIDFRSTSNVDLDTFTVEDVLAPEIRIQKLWTPVVWGDMDGKFDLSYKTNHSTDWILWETRSTDDVTPLDVADLGLASDEYITALQFKYGEVQAGFTSRNEDLAEQPALRNFSLMILMDLSSMEEVVTQPTELYPATYMVKAAYAMSSGSINASVTAVGTLGEKSAAADDNAVTEVIAPVNLAEIPLEQSAITEEGLVVNPPEVISGTTTTIEDDEVPLGSSVKTGDDRNLGLYAILLAGSAAMLTGLWITGHKNRKRARSVMDTKGGAK